MPGIDDFPGWRSVVLPDAAAINAELAWTSSVVAGTEKWHLRMRPIGFVER
jgi:hypothetical protein